MKHTGRLKQKTLVYCLFLLVLLVPLTACFSQETPAEDIPRGGEIVWSVVGVEDLDSLDPAQAGEQQSIIVMNLVFGGLLRLDADLRVQPDAASRWDVSADGKTYTFHLRKELKFGDGSPVTAQDFVYSINRALKPSTAAYAAPSHLKHIVGAEEVIEGKADAASGVRSLDEHTLEIELDAPLAYFLSWLTSPHTFAVPQKLIEEHGEDWTDHAFGTGPFRVKEWKHGEEIVLEANPHYWMGLPGVETLRMPFFQDNEVAYQRYRQGELDIMGNRQTGVPAARVSEVQALPDFRTASALAVRYIGFNNHLPPFDNVYVRQAFAFSVDRLELAQITLSGTVEPTGRILPRGLARTDYAVKGQAFDPEGARRALRLAGYLSAQELPAVSLAYAEEGENELVARTLQNFWRDTLGIEVTLEGLDLQTFSQRLDETFMQPEEGLQMYLSIWGADYPDPQNFISQQLRTGSPNNNGNWSNEEFDTLVDQADRMGQQNLADERLKLYAEAEQIALEEVGWLPLYNPRLNVLISPAVQGLVFTPQGIIAPDWQQVRITKTEG
jgi:peptide/nickel transport system substrate-binding protein/oligopeptide transport system substrate-binding protein